MKADDDILILATDDSTIEFRPAPVAQPGSFPLAKTLLGRYYISLGRAYSFLGEREQAMQKLQRALAEGTHHGDAVIMGRAHRHLATEHSFLGDPQQQVAHAQQAVSLFEGTEERLGLGRCLQVLGLDS